MKRELAALETRSPVLDSNGRKTRSTKCGESNGVPERLVYKRVKRSVKVDKVDLVKDATNGVVEDLKDHGVVKERENGVPGVSSSELVKPENVEKSVVDGKERENGVAGVASEPVEGTPVEGERENGVASVASEPVEGTPVEGERENGVASVASEPVEGTPVEGERENGVASVASEPVERMEVEGEERENGVAGVASELEERMEVEGETKIVTEDNGGLRNDLREDGGVVKNVESDNGEVNNLAIEEQHLMVEVENRDVSLVGASDPVIINAVNGDSIVDGTDKDAVLEGTSTKSVSNGGNRTVKKTPVQKFSRRFTRSALKSKADTSGVAGDSDTVRQNEENGSVVMSKSNVEDGREGIFSETQLGENNGELKDSAIEEHPKRVTRSNLKSKGDEDSALMEASDSVVTDKENTEPVMSDGNAEADMDKDANESMSASPTKRKMEMKMSKQIALAKIPRTVKELLETGYLEGCPVHYKGVKGPMLRGRFRGVGILCYCGLCQGCKVVPPSLFEIHACNTYKRASQYIHLDNGRSLIDILKACRSKRLSTVEATIQNAVGPVPEKILVVCQNCKERFSTMDAESSEAVCSACVMSNVSPVGPVFSFRRLCRSSKSVCPSVPSQAALAMDMRPGRSQGKSIEKSPEAFVTPKIRSSSRVGKSSVKKTTSKRTKIPQEVLVEPKRRGRPPKGKSSETKSSEKLMKKSIKAALSPKVVRLGKKSSPAIDCVKATKKSRKEVLTPKPSKSLSIGSSSEKKTSGKITRKDLRLHKLVFEDDILPDGTELGYYARGQKLLDGYKKGSGIFCNCCDTVVSASLFEAHAGCSSRRKPYCYIYTSNGVSLHELSINLIKGRTQSTKFNDDLCSICADGGNLLLCDGCPRAFHMECASLPSIPRGKWYCKYCQNMFEREKFVSHNANALAAGRVSGVDPIEQITTRSIRIVSNVASEMSSCILCRGFDFCKSGFGPRTIILCDQCEKEYHVGCLKDHNMADLAELPEGKWFCSLDCGRIESALQNLLVRGAEKLPKSLVNIIQEKHTQQGSEFSSDIDVSWRLLSGKIASPETLETRSLLSQAVAIFHESFAPIIDVVSGNDLIPAMVYGRPVGGQEYGGMYCAVLTINSVVVSAGIFRVFGPDVAELPLVATIAGNHGKGYFQALFACIERLLAFLKVKSLVLPAAEEAESIWTKRFGFTKMTPDEVREFKRNYWTIVRFQGTSMLQKSVPECRIIQTQSQAE